MEDVNIEVGKRIQEVRKAKGFSQSDLAQASGLAKSFISWIETGRKSPTLRSLSKIAKALDMPLQELLSSCVKHDNNADS